MTYALPQGINRTPTVWIAIVIVVLCFAALDAVHVYVGSLGEQQHLPLHYVLYRVHLFWLIYLALLPPLFAFIERHCLDLKAPTSLLVHICAAVTFAYSHLLLFSLTFLFSPAHLDPELEYTARFFRLLRQNFAADFMTYWAVLAGSYTFNYYWKWREQVAQEMRLETHLAETRLQALQRQFSPHFLFNTLNSIAVLAQKRDHDAVIDTVGRLSDLIRISLDETSPPMVPLAYEIKLAEAYLEIQRILVEHRLKTRYDIAPDTLNALVPRMILQPLIENAVLHGRRPTDRVASIAIAADGHRDVLRLSVSDSGPGFERRRPAKDGIGLANTRERIRQLYGSPWGIELGRSTEGGASVTITIPLMPSDSPAGRDPVEYQEGKR